MKKEKGPIRIPRDRARRARSLKAAAVAVVNRAYLELVAAGRSHDAALSELAAVAGITKNGVRNWLSNTNRPGKVAAEAIVLKYDRDLSARYGLLPLDRPDPAAGAQREIVDPPAGGPEPPLIQTPPDPPPPSRRRTDRPAGPSEVQDPPASTPPNPPAPERSLGELARLIDRELDRLRVRIDDRTLAILDEILSLKKYNAGLQARLEKSDLVVEALRTDLLSLPGIVADVVKERTAGIRIDVASVGVLATDIKNIISGRPTADLGRPLIGLSVQKKEDGFWLYLDDFARGKSGAIHIETGLPLLRDLLARAAGPMAGRPDELDEGLPAGDPRAPSPRCLCSIVPADDPADPGIPGPPPANGSDRSEPGLSAINDDLGK